MDIRLAVPEDETWIKPIWDEKIFWQFGIIWWRYWNGGYKGKGMIKPGEFWIVAEGYGFCHYNQRRDGWLVVHEIGVDPNARRCGIGGALLDYIGLPITLKTDCDNTASNAFYRAYGMLPAAKVRARSGKWMMIYEKG